MPIRRRQPRGGIERKFLTSILWVGVIPMALALIIGYAFAREGQQIAVEQNLATAASSIVQGIRLDLANRIRMAGQLAEDTAIVAALSGAAPRDAALARLEAQSARTGESASQYALYDREGNLLLETADWDAVERRHPDWQQRFKTAGAASPLRYYPEVRRYATQIVAPVRAEAGGAAIGFVSASQGIDEWVGLIRGGGAGAARTGYEVVYLADDERYVAHVDDLAGDSVKPPQYGLVDPSLAQRLREAPDRDANSLMLWGYTTRGRTISALLAYQRLFDGAPYYIVAFRSSADVFTNINLAALLTIAVTSLVIALFVVIAYRIVNNNVIRPVSLLNEGAQIIRQGDFDLKLIVNTGDEIEELSQSFNKMATALRQNITRLEASEEKYRNLITSMRDGIYQTGPDGHVTFMNPAGVEILGFDTVDEALGASLPGLFVEEIDYARVLHELERSQFVERTRVWMRRPGGVPLCVELTANRVFTDLGELIGIEGSFRDVTQNVRLEQEARERSERIAVINQMANAINSSLEAGRVYESLVAEVRKLVGFDYAAVALVVVGQPTFQTRQLWPELPGAEVREDGEESCAAWVAREGAPLVIDHLRDGRSPFAQQFPEGISSCACLPLYAAGRIIGTLNLGAAAPGAFSRHALETLEQMTPHVAVAIRNASLLENLQQSLEEVTRARENLHDANEELKTLDEMKTNLLSNVSHELRTPLVAVMGYTDMILNEKAGPVNELQHEYLGISLRNIEKLVTLIENLLDFSRLHRGQEDMVFDVFDLAACARASMQIVQPVADSRRIALVLDAPERAVLVEGDKGKLGQVFNNLLSNAVKFNHPEGSVTIGIRPSDATVTVSVSDTGIGIPKEALDKVFTRFYQYDASSTRKYGGTGIGLAIAQDIMRLHGSRITVSSEEGKGAVFHFTLPLADAGAGAPESGEAPGKALPTETHLLVEVVTQDRSLSAQLRQMLVAEHMDIIHAAYGDAAVSLAQKYSPDCIVVDSEAGPAGSIVVEDVLHAVAEHGTPVILLTEDDALYERFRGRVSARVRRSFRKSTLLSGIHYALSRGVGRAGQLGDKVLCVDDDAVIVEFIKRCLEAEGYAVDHASNGEEALVKAAQGDYWLVLLDVAMPGMDGWEVCKRLKTNPQLAGLLVYFVTAKPVEKSLGRLRDSEADGYLPKPFKGEELTALVQSIEWRPARSAPAAHADAPGAPVS